MSRLDEIGITVIPPDSPLASGPSNAPAILHEIENALTALVERGEGSSIDLNGLPLAPGDRERLEQALGDGELSAEVQALGPTQVRETGIHGVWWVTHCNRYDQVIAEFIEITYTPEILKTDPEDAQPGAAAPAQPARAALRSEAPGWARKPVAARFAEGTAGGNRATEGEYNSLLERRRVDVR